MSQPTQNSPNIATVSPWLLGRRPVSCGTGVLTRPVAVLLVAGSLALLLFSFGRDTHWLWPHRAVASTSGTAKVKH